MLTHEHLAKCCIHLSIIYPFATDLASGPGGSSGGCHFALFAPSLPPDYFFGLWSVWLLPLDHQFAVFT